MLKTNELILMQISTISTLGVRSSKVKVTRGPRWVTVFRRVNHLGAEPGTQAYLA